MRADFSIKPTRGCLGSCESRHRKAGLRKVEYPNHESNGEDQSHPSAKNRDHSLPGAIPRAMETAVSAPPPYPKLFFSETTTYEEFPSCPGLTFPGESLRLVRTPAAPDVGR